MLKDVSNIVSCFLANLFANQVGEKEIMSSPSQLELHSAFPYRSLLQWF